MLTGDASNPLVTGGHHAVDRPHTATSQRPQFGGRLQMKQQIIQITAKVAQDHRDGTSVARQDRRPQTRVGRCDTSGVSQALPRKTQRLGGSINETRCQHRRHQLRDVRNKSHRMIVRTRVHLQRHRANIRGESTSDQHRPRPREFVGHNDPRPPVKQICIRRAGTGTLPTSHRVRTHVALSLILNASLFESCQNVRNNRILD